METDISVIKNAHINQDHIDSLIRISECEGLIPCCKAMCWIENR